MTFRVIVPSNVPRSSNFAMEMELALLPVFHPPLNDKIKQIINIVAHNFELVKGLQLIYCLWVSNTQMCRCLYPMFKLTGSCNCPSSFSVTTLAIWLNVSSPNLVVKRLLRSVTERRFGAFFHMSKTPQSLSQRRFLWTLSVSSGINAENKDISSDPVREGLGGVFRRSYPSRNFDHLSQTNEVVFQKNISLFPLFWETPTMPSRNLNRNYAKLI